MAVATFPTSNPLAVSLLGGTAVVAPVVTPPAPSDTYLATVSTTPAGAFGLAKMVSAYSGPSVRVVRASDNAEQDIGFVGAAFDTASALTFQGASSLTVRTCYDQTGNGNHLTQPTVVNRPPLWLGGVDGVPVMQTGGTVALLIPSTLTADRQGITAFDVGRIFSSFNTPGYWEFGDLTTYDLGLRGQATKYTTSPLYDATIALPTVENRGGLPVCNMSCVSLTSSASGMTTFRDDQSNAYAAATAKAMVLGGQWGTTHTIKGSTDKTAFVVYPAALSTPDEAAVRASIKTIFKTTETATSNNILQGDSITFGTGSSFNRNISTVLLNYIAFGSLIRNYGQEGKQIGSGSDWGSVPTRYTQAGVPNILRVSLGTNDLVNGTSLASVIAGHINNCTLARVGGTANYIIGVTQLTRPLTPSITADMRALNEWIRSNPLDSNGVPCFDAICDLAHTATIGDVATDASQGMNATANSPDKIHPSQARIIDTLAPEYTASLQSLGLGTAVVRNPVTVGAPVSTVDPVVTGSNISGTTISISSGTWSNATGTPYTVLPAKFTYALKKNGTVISSRATYARVDADIGGTLTWEVTASNAGGSVTRTVSVPATIASGALNISGTPVTTGTVGVAYGPFTPTVTGGTAPYTFSSVGTALPPGLSLNTSTGQVSGSPSTAATTSGIIIRVTDSAGTPATANLPAFNIVVSAAATSPTITGTPGAATVGSAYTFTPTLSGGVSPYTVVLLSGALPTSTSLNPSTGAVTGTPTVASTYSFTLQVTDTNSATATLATSITVASASGSLPLDSLSSAPASAYSFRKLRTAYSGSAIRVQRSSDSTEQDIGFNGSGDLDTTALTAFVGANSAGIMKWYDQSGNGVDWTAATYTAAPKIVNAGTLVTKNSKPNLLISTNILMSGTLSASVTDRTIAAVASHNTNGTAYLLSSSANGGLAYSFRNTTHNFNWEKLGTGAIAASTSGPAASTLGTLFSRISATASDHTLNGTAVGTPTPSPSTSTLTAGLTATLGPANAQTTTVSELIVWNVSTVSSGDQSAIQANQKTYWGTP